jgi:NTE family protein
MPSPRFGLLVPLALIRVAAAQECAPARTALVLSGGGVKGLAHIGVLQALDSLGARPDLIVGTSMGAIVGGLYASGYTGREIDSLARSLPIAEVVRPFRVPAPHPWDRRPPLLFMVKGRNGFELQTGVVDETQPNARLNTAMLRGNLLARGRFDRLPIPFLAVATDLRDRSTVVLGQGDLARAVRASSAIPLVFPPVVVGGAVLVDGGLSANIPVAEARAAGARRVIVVDVTEHPEDSLDVESPLALADQLLGFLFQQPFASLGPNDLMIRPAVQRYRSLDFSPETVAEILHRGRRAADTTLGRAGCLPLGPPPVVPPLPGTLAGWSVATGVAADSTLIARMLGLRSGAAIRPVELRQRLIGLADAEAFRGIWLNPEGGSDSVTFRIEPIKAPETVGGAGVAYDHELGGQAWAGVFDRRAWGTSLEASALLALGRLQRELYAAALWHTDAGWSRVTPMMTLRLRTEDVRRFDAGGQELPALGTSDARLSLAVELRGGEAWRIRVGADAFAFGTEPTRGEAALGGSLRVEREGWRGPQIAGDAALTGRFQWARIALLWPVARRSWSIRPAARLGWGNDLPTQWTHSLGGEEGFPGLHLGERRGTREAFGSVRIGYAVKGPVEIRALVAAGRAWSPGTDAQDWQAGGRLGVGADTPAGPIDVAYGVATSGRHALYLRLGKWF